MSPRQSAHGLCAHRRVTRTSARGDARAAVSTFVLKVVTKAATSKEDYKNCHSGAKGTVARYMPSKRHRGARRRALRSQAYRPWPVALQQGRTRSPAMDQVHGRPPGRALSSSSVAMWLPFPPKGNAGRGPGLIYKETVYDQGRGFSHSHQLILPHSSLVSKEGEKDLLQSSSTIAVA